MASMNDRPFTRLFILDLFAQALLALGVGLAASIVLAATVMLLAGTA